MEVENYLNLVLQKESITKSSPEIKSLQVEREKVEKLINKHFENRPVIRYAGSYKKGTMIKRSYDLDISCYFKHEDNSAGETLKEIYENIKKAFEDEYSVISKKSALRLNSSGGDDFHIDIVPGRFIDNSEKDVFLFQTEGERQRLQTNLDKHISHIKDSGLVETIKLVKVWKEINVLDIKTFILELLVVKVLSKMKDADGLESCLIKFWEELRDNVDQISVEDPANSAGNDLSRLFNSSVKTNLSSLAEKTLKLTEEDRWEDIFRDDSSSSRNSKSNKIIPPSIVPGPPSPPRPPRNREVG